MRAWAPHVRKLGRMNWALTVSALALTVAGVLFIFSATYAHGSRNELPMHERQLYFALAGLVVYVAFTLIDYRALLRYAGVIYMFAVFLLALVLLVGTVRYGAQRWIRIAGPIGVQPSEFAKLAVMLFLARSLALPGEALQGWRPLLKRLAVVVLPVALVLKQPDMGTAAIFLPMAGLMMFVEGVRWQKLATLVVLLCLGSGLVLGALFLPEKLDVAQAPAQRALGWIGVRDYHRNRILGFVDPNRDPRGTGWNKIQSQIAIGSGGAVGKGWLQGTQNLLGYLPRSVAPTDFIYSVIAEEKGFVGSVAVLSLFALLVGSALWTAMKARDATGRLLCTGVATMLFFHVWVNVSMTIGLMPVTGLPLPLLSYGGSFMLVAWAALGMVQSVHIRLKRDEAFQIV